MIYCRKEIPLTNGKLFVASLDRIIFSISRKKSGLILKKSTMMLFCARRRREHGGPSPCPVLLRTAWLAWQISCAFTSANDSSWTSSLADNIEAGCGELYRRYSEDHTGCLAVRKDSSCRPLQEGLADSDREMILDAHNMYRNKVASGGEAANGLPAAANMMQVVSRVVYQ